MYDERQLHTDEHVPPPTTAWGQLQTAERLAEGVWIVTTASHGGVWVSETRLDEWNARFPTWGVFSGAGIYEPWTGSPQWWEEDCDWVIPVLVFRGHIRKRGIVQQAEAAVLNFARAAKPMKNDYARVWDAINAEIEVEYPDTIERDADTLLDDRRRLQSCLAWMGMEGGTVCICDDGSAYRGLTQIAPRGSFFR